MNRKGFMMAELIVVSAVIIVTIATFFSSYGRIIAKYNRLLNYYDIGTIYRLGYYYHLKPEDYTDKINVQSQSKNPESLGDFTYTDTLYIGKCSNMKSHNISDTLTKEYINHLKSLNIDDAKTCTILKSCQKKAGIDTEKCKFAYMEV